MTTKTEPAIIAYGRSLIDNYPVDEYRTSLVRAFKQGRADFIVLDDNPNGQKFRAACTAWAIDQELLYNDCSDGDGQQIVSSFRLTEKGKKEILGQSS